jgi:hypothetical protein
MASTEVSTKIDMKPTDAERSPDKTAEQTERGCFRLALLQGVAQTQRHTVLRATPSTALAVFSSNPVERSNNLVTARR